jgi:hypothetical protein
MVAAVLTKSWRYPVRMNIAASRAFGALRIVASRCEIEKDPVLRKGIER